MESPSALSRSPSATFAPGSRGRRSQTNIHHLSLAPLTPRYPVDPADYDAYFDPSTATLHTSASLSQISPVPSPGGILSPVSSRSRATSKTPRLKRKTKSTVSIQAPNDVVVSPITGEGLGGLAQQQHKKYLRLHTDSSWLVQTGLALTEGSRESKGQSWISKRDSSTSLQSPQSPEDYMLSARARSRSMPRSASRQKSRRGMFSMTPSAAAITPLDENVVPDWADSQTQAEIAAQVENELAEEFDEEDRYGVLDFEGNFFSDNGNNDEEEVREAIMRGKSSWFDGVVDVFLKLEDDPREDDDVDDLEAGLGKSGDTVSDVESPPTGPRQGVWEDVAWFGRLLVRTVRS